MLAPNFALKDIQTNEMKTLSHYKGKIVMLTFWASWCPDCLKDLPLKEKLYQNVNNEDVVFLTINVAGREGNPTDGITFIKKHNFTFPVLLDEGTKTYDTYRCMSIPTTILIDRDQKISASFHDRSTIMDIMQSLSLLLNG
jgi:thiol-disulfide isomerase/thioredoxin